MQAEEHRLSTQPAKQTPGFPAKLKLLLAVGTEQRTEPFCALFIYKIG